MPGPRLVLAGGGHASLHSLMRASEWRRRGAEVTLINDHPRLFYSGMTPEYLGGVYTLDEVAIDLSGHCERLGVTLVTDRIVAVDASHKRIRTSSGEEIVYDVAALDIGAENPALPSYAIPTKPLHRLEALSLLMARCLSGDQPDASIVIAGGGAAGAEIALNISSRLAARTPGRSPLLDGTLRLTIVESSTRLVPDFPEGMSRRIASTLAKRGVETVLSDRVNANAEDVLLLASGRKVKADLVIWSTGSVGHAFLKASGLPTDEKGFLLVDEHLMVTEAHGLFAAGDCATLVGRPLPKVGVHAVKQGPVLRHNLDQALFEAEPRFRKFQAYPIAPLILSTGTREGMLVAGSVWAYGEWALRLKHFVDRRWMQKYNREHWGSSLSLSLADTRNAGDHEGGEPASSASARAM
jgi:NADH dehydrogenase FAD-containing subunit